MTEYIQYAIQNSDGDVGWIGPEKPTMRLRPGERLVYRTLSAWRKVVGMPNAR